MKLEDLFKAHYARVARLAASIVRDGGRAEEIAVEVFLRWQEAGVLTPDDAAGAWLTRVTLRLAVDELRRHARNARMTRVLSYFAGHRRVPTPEEQHAAGQEQEQVRAVLSRLKPRQAELLLLRHQGLSYQELALALSLHPASVGQQVARAQQAFRKEYVQRYGQPWRTGSYELGG